MPKKIQPTHPGIILKEEFLDPLGIKRGTLARHIGVDRSRINEICKGNREISADTALRLSKALGTTARYWSNLQAHYDLELARDQIKHSVLLSISEMEYKSAVA